MMLCLGKINMLQAQSLLVAKQTFQNGYFEQAIEQWQTILATTQKINERLEALLGIASTYRRLGAYDNALKTINIALPIALQHEPIDYALLHNELSKLRLSQGENWRKEALRQLKTAFKLARQINNPILLAEVLNHQGNFLSTVDDYEGAKEAYEKALLYIKSSTKSASHFSNEDIEALYSKVLINQAFMVFSLETEMAYQHDDKAQAFKASIAALEQALPVTQNRQETYSQVFGLIAISQLSRKIQSQLSTPAEKLTSLAYQALTAARAVAVSLDNSAAKAYANGYLGQLYEQAKRYDDALSLTRQAQFFAGQTRSQLQLYLWQWQLGRILKAQGKYQGAIRAYQEAIKNLGSVRTQVANMGYFNITKNFQEQVMPVYFELVDLLLQQARFAQNNSTRDRLLLQARNLMEAFKAAELQDYFQSECLAIKNKCSHVEQMLDAQTAVLYPIVLSGRLELLLQRSDGLVQTTVPISKVKLRDTIASFLSPLRHHPNPEQLAKVQMPDQLADTCKPSWRASTVQMLDTLTNNRFLEPAKTLYSLLIKPLIPQLHDIKTLVIVSDGALRTIPFAALHDGEEFLIEKYALVLSPGLCYRFPKSQLRQKRAKILLIGLSDAVQGFSSLPCAEYELDTLQGLFHLPSQPLLNSAFTISQVHTEMNENAYSIVHIASHGQFSANLKNTFVLTYNDKLSMDKLEDLMNLTILKNDPVDLLTLSACETAVGDDRAALGLAGVALKAGVQSALASLWKVDDEATPAVVIEFYRQLQNPNISKAEALQKAQKMILTDKLYERYRHPYFWSAFLLIGNWL